MLSKISKILALTFFGFNLIAIFLLLAILQPILAQNTDHFYTSLTSTYTVDATGNTRVQHAFLIRNLTPEYFITRYGLKLGTDSISNISVVSGQQVINPEINQSDGSTQINIEFPDKLVGKDKVREFTITYSNPVMSEVNGRVLETYIPSMSSEANYNEHQVLLVTPVIFGHPSRINPENYTIKQDGQNFILTYESLGEKGVSAIFGSEQIFNLNIRYHLNNPNSQPAITQVSLPPDTPYQKVFYHQLEPRPQEIDIDLDGNWIATYYLPANNIVNVDIQITVLVSLEQIQPWLNISPTSVHTSSQPFWEIDRSEILELAQQYSQPEDIYQFVVKNLSYTQEDITQKFERLGAIKALKNPHLSTCQEFSDVFIAIARANNIPARRTTGYAHSNDPVLQPLSLVTDVLHAWPEYYDQEQQSWIPIDPTWGNTMQGIDYFNQFDLKHIVFAYNGKSSRYPLAAGDYKLPDQESKDIEVEFGQELPSAEANFSITVQSKKLLGFINLPSWYKLSIENHTGQAWYDNQLEIKSDVTEVVINNPQQQLVLLPWQKKTINIQVFNQNNWLPKEDQIQLSLSSSEYEHQENISLKTIKPVAAQIPINKIEQGFKQLQLNTKSQQVRLTLGIFAGVVTLTAGSLLVFKRKQ